jgi:hypothetical protein
MELTNANFEELKKMNFNQNKWFWVFQFIIFFYLLLFVNQITICIYFLILFNILLLFI